MAENAEIDTLLAQVSQQNVSDNVSVLLEARLRCPALLREEVSPELFRRIAGGNNRKAAMRLCRYWLKRRELLESLAFERISELPTEQFGSPAATLLSNGWINAVAAESDKPSVIHIDQTKCTSTPTPKDLSLALLHSLTDLSQSAARQSHGAAEIVLLLSLTDDSIRCFQGMHIIDIICTLLSVFPFYLRSFHVLHKTKVASTEVKSLPRLAVLCLRLYSCLGHNKAVVHTGGTYQQFEQKLQKYQVPNLHCFASFAGVSRKVKLQTSLAFRPPPSHEKMTEQIDVPSGNLASAKERNKIYSRRKYYRKKIENQVLEEQATSLTELNRGLKVEQERLESLLRQAQNHIESLNKR